MPQTVSAQVQPEGVHRAVFAWMQCQDCMSDERERVLAMGDSAVPLLRDLLLDGPPPEHVAAVGATMQELVRRARRDRMPSAAVIEAQLDSFESLYRIRAISALAGIGSGRAREALCAARVARQLSGEVRVMVGASLARLGATCP